MSPELVGVLTLVGIALPISVCIASRGDALDRLVGLEMAGVIVTLALMSLAQLVGQPSYLIVPTVGVVLSFAGTLVFVRFLAPTS